MNTEDPAAKWRADTFRIARETAAFEGRATIGKCTILHCQCIGGPGHLVNSPDPGEGERKIVTIYAPRIQF